MGDLVQFRRAGHANGDAELTAAYAAFAEALSSARRSGSVREMAVAVRAYEAWLALAIPDPVSRSEVWP